MHNSHWIINFQIQRYEGASTIYGPHTLTIYLKQYQELVQAAVQVSKLNIRIRYAKYIMQRYYQFEIEKIFLCWQDAINLIMKNISPLSNQLLFSQKWCIIYFFTSSQNHRYLTMCKIYIEHVTFILSLLQYKPVPPGPPAPQLLQSNLISLVPPVLYDTPRWGHNFGDVVRHPRKAAWPGDTVTAIFVSISLVIFTDDLYHSEKAF